MLRSANYENESETHSLVSLLQEYHHIQPTYKEIAIYDDNEVIYQD